MPKQNTTKSTNTKLKQKRRNMINSGEPDKGIIKQVDHKALALESTTYKKYNK